MSTHKLNVTILQLQAEITTLKSQFEHLNSVQKMTDSDMDRFWLLFGGGLVFFMQAGFSLLEAGSVREKNIHNILFKNLMDAAIGSVAFWLLGFGIAFGSISTDGHTENPFIGDSNFALWREKNGIPYQGYSSFFFQWAFAATSATIVSGAVAERTKIPAYFIYSAVLTSFIYPVVVHWVWDSDGWLNMKMIDFAGSGVVHMVGGFSALTGTLTIGARIGRFHARTDGKTLPDLVKFKSHTVYDIPGHSSLLAALGVAILWFGWYGFNCASTLAITNGASFLAVKVATTTTISAVFGALTVSFLKKCMDDVWDLLFTLNGVLGGLVSITAGCAVVDLWAACIIGIISGFLLLGASTLLKKLKIDDPVDAFPVHGVCGLWGVIAAGLFANRENATFAGYPYTSYGTQIGHQFLGAASIAAWTLITSGILFQCIECTIGMRVSPRDEVGGLDEADHGIATQRSSSVNSPDEKKLVDDM